MPILFGQINSASTTSTQFVDIGALNLTLPPATETVKHALVVLNAPTVFCNGIDLAELAINFNGSIVASGTFNYQIPLPQNQRTFPITESFTLVTRVKLGTANTVVRAQWRVTSNKSILSVNSFTSLTATIA